MKAFNPLLSGRKFLFVISFSFIALPFLFAIKNIKFSVDLSLLVSQNKFNPATDIVYIRGTFNSWGTTTPLTAAGNNIYSVTIPLTDDSWYEYKYFINTSGAPNSGWETNFPITSSGNRRIYIGVNDLTLPIVFYNDGEMDKVKTTSHFIIYYTDSDNSYIEDFASRIEICYTNISKAIQSFPTAKANIYLYKDLDQLHMACGYPENGPSSIGSAWGATLITMLAPSKSGLDDALGLFNHEYTHCLIASKTKVILPAWLNEGVASYYGQNFSTKDWIKSVMDQEGKPNIADVFNGNMGYAYSSIVAYYIIKTKGEAAMAKFIENMNYADIGYPNLEALQADWWTFLDVYLDNQTTVNVKFSVDMADMIGAGYFKSATDKVYVKGSFNDWAAQQLTLESGTIYSGTVAIKRYNFFDYKFYTNSATAPNGGDELNTDETTQGNRLLDVENTNKTLATVKFKSTATNSQVNELDMTSVNNKIDVLNAHIWYWFSGQYLTANYQFKQLTPAEYQSQKPTDNLAFDAGFVDSNGIINISEPTTSDQKAVFPNLTKVALYYLCQSYIYNFYQTRNLPLMLKVGFGFYEAGLLPADTDIKTIVNVYGGSLTSFDVLNDPVTFVNNKGFVIAGVFGEFMNVYKNWAYQYITQPTINGFNTDSNWFNTGSKQELLADFNRYLYARFLQPVENSRVKICVETDHFKFYTTPDDAAINFPYFSTVTETAYNEYVNNFNLRASEKLTFFTLPGCKDGSIEGLACDPNGRLTGGTAWSSGLHSTSSPSTDLLPSFYHQNRHELAHVFQGLMHQGKVTAWLNEGFPELCTNGPITDEALTTIKQNGINSLTGATTYFGHRPTYEETRIYPSPDYGYYTLGYFFNDYIYRRGGYNLLKAVQQNDLTAYQSLGYTTAQSFLNDFYFDFDVRLLNKKVATLITPTINVDETSSTVNISWTPLSPTVKLNVAVSTDNGATWTTLAANTTATSCNWDAGNYIGEFRVKFSAPDVFDHQTTYGPFNKIDLAKPMINFPIGNEYLIAADTVAISWANTTLSNFNIEFSGDNGSSWTTVSPAVIASAKVYKWIVPWIISNQCKIRISDAANATNNDLSDHNFTILPPNLIGGPYLLDKNTVALLHFDTDLNNRSNLSGNGVGLAQNIVSDATMSPLLGNCYRTTSAVTVPHHANLSLTGDWTIEAWVKPTSFNPNGNMYILTKPGDTDSYASNYSLEINPWWGNVFHGFYFSDASSRVGISNYALALNQWYHIAFVRDTKASEVKILVHDKNRTLVSSQTATYTGYTTFVNTKDVVIGSGIDGYIDEVRISNIVRSFTSTPLNSPVENKLLSVFPNPSNGRVQLHLQPEALNAELSVLSLDGQLVLRKRVTNTPDFTLDLTSVSKGVYFIHIADNNKNQIVKLIIQ